MSKISVIVVNWNGRDLLGDCLSTLRQQTFRDFEVILIDNGSTDESVALIRREFPEVQLITLDINLGFCGGNNRGFRAAQGDFIFFLNNDTKAHPAILERLYKVIERDPERVGSWAVKMLRWEQSDRIDNCGCGYSSFGGGYQIGTGELDRPFQKSRWVFGPSGGAGCYRRTVLEDIGLFDEDFFYNNEDVDLNFRAQLAGYQCHFVPEAIIYHRGSATGGATSDNTIYHIQRNKEWVFFKNMPSSLLWKYLLFHCLYSFGWILYWTMKGKGKVVLRAKWDALYGWRTVWNKRCQIQSRRRACLHYLDSIIDRRRVSRLWRH